VAGFLLASLAVGAGGTWRCVLAALTSLLLYAAGLVQNDLAGLDEDSRERPERPLPRRAISTRAAWIAFCALAGLALVSAASTGIMAALVLAVVLIVLITLYNRVTSQAGAVGAVNMGLCRGLSLLVGASAAGGWASVWNWPVIMAAVMMVCYIVAITVIASTETVTSRIGAVRWAPAIVLGVGFPIILAALFTATRGRGIQVSAFGAYASLILMGVAVAWAIHCGRRLIGVCPPARVGQTVGMLVRGLVVIQAALTAVAGQAWVVVALLAAWAVAGVLARRFASS
jgi:4-hydroxybenzoate polyprenyltransferase